MYKPSKNGVSAVVPCYNDGLFIKKAINSLLNQTQLPNEIIIVDDGSSEPTLKVLRAFNHPLIKCIYQKNKGVSAARNAGIEKALTSFVLTLDADDYFEPSFVEKACLILKSNPEVAMVCSYYQKFDKQGISTEIIRPQGFSVEHFLVKNNGVASALFRKQCWKFVGGYDDRFKKGYEDWDFWISILSSGWNMRVIKEPLFFYRQKANSRDKTAFNNFDRDLRLLLFNKHKQVYTDKIDYFAEQLLSENARLRKTLKKREMSKEYRWGMALLQPIRAIKNRLKSPE